MLQCVAFLQGAMAGAAAAKKKARISSSSKDADGSEKDAAAAKTPAVRRRMRTKMQDQSGSFVQALEKAMKKAKAKVGSKIKPMQAMKKAKAMKSYGKRRSRKTKGRKSKSRAGQAAKGELCTMLLDCLDSASESESEHGLDLSSFNSIQSSDETSDDTSPCTEDGGAFPETGNTSLFDIIMAMVRQMPADMFARLVANWQILSERSALKELATGSGCTGSGLDHDVACTISQAPTSASCVVKFELDRGPMRRLSCEFGNVYACRCK